MSTALRAAAEPIGNRRLVRRAAMPVALLAIVALAFSPVLSVGFVDMDDAAYVTQNPHVLSGLTWAGARWAFAPSGRTYWSPLTWLSLMLDVELFGVEPGPIHAVALLLHAASAILLFLALARMTGRPWIAFAVAGLYAGHPLHVESIAWAAERKTVLAGCLTFGALLGYAFYVERPSAARYVGVAAPFLLGLLAKPMIAATLPALLLLLDLWPLGRTRWVRASTARGPPPPLRTLLLEKLPLVGATAAVLGLVAGTMPLAAKASLSERVTNALTGYGRYVAKAFWPAELAPFYPQQTLIPTWEWVSAAVALCAPTALLLSRRAPRPALVGWLWFLGTMVPFSGIVRHSTPLDLWPSMADRFMYFPLAGLAVAAVWPVAARLEDLGYRRILLGALGVILVAEIARARAYARHWSDTPMPFRSAIAVAARTAPELPEGHLAVGILRHAAGDLAGAETAYREALRLAPDSADALYNLAILARRRGDVQEARDLLERALRAGFTEVAEAADALNALGAADRALGRPREAERTFREALRRSELHWLAAVNLASLLAEERRHAEALAALADARARAARSHADPAPIEREASRILGSTR